MSTTSRRQTDADRQVADMGRSFAAIDFETGASERSTACAVGVIVFEQGQPTDKLNMLIRPPGNRYNDINSNIHGISPSDTRHAPDFPEVWEQVAPLLNGRLIVAHNAAFDFSVLRRSAEYYGYVLEPFPYICTYRLARTALPHAGTWRLDALAGEFGIPLVHHDPLSDANAAGLLWMALLKRFGTTPSELLAGLGHQVEYFRPGR